MHENIESDFSECENVISLNWNIQPDVQQDDFLNIRPSGLCILHYYMFKPRRILAGRGFIIWICVCMCLPLQNLSKST